MTLDAWLATHPYLQSVSSLHMQVDAAIAEMPAISPSVPSWEDYISHFLAGLPLLQSSAIDLTPVEKMVRSLLERLASSRMPGNVTEEARILKAELDRKLDAPRCVTAWLFDDGIFASACPGLLRYVGWTSLSRYLRPLVDTFGRWREEETWLRSYCPTCGSPPAMAQLVGTDPGRRRLLSCGHCSTRWQYRRTACPFCENADDHRLAVLMVQGEEGLRIDYCESCKGYLKTYDGQGSETVLLADWTSIHLDVIAADRGLKRLAASLYEL